MTFRNPPARRRASTLEVDDIVHIRNGVDEVHLGGTYFSGVPRWRITDIKNTYTRKQIAPGLFSLEFDLNGPFTWVLVRVGDRKQVEHQFTPGVRGVYVAETVK